MYAKLSAPLTCQIEITTECPLKCQHCYNFWRQDDDSPAFSLSASDAEIVLQKLKEAEVFNIVITGGEPLSNFKTLEACLRFAKKESMQISLNTNLLPLTERRANVLRELGIASVLTSFPAHNEELYDEITQRKGAFKHFLRKVEIAQKAGIRVVASMVVSKKNLPFMKDTALFAQSLGLKDFIATKAGCPGNCSDFSEFGLSIDEFRQYLSSLREIKLSLGMKVDGLEGYPLCGVRDLDLYEFTLSRKCSAGISYLTVSSTGLVRPCPHIDISYGNIFLEEFSQIWKRMDSWRNGEFLPNVCKTCKLLGLCGGGCRMEGKTCHGEISSPDKYCVPEDIDTAFESLSRRTKNQVAQQVTEKTSFTVLPYRSRKESFGMTIASKGKAVALLNEAGADIFSQFTAHTTYLVNDPRISWGSLNPVNFVSGLLRRGLIVLTPEG